MKVTLSLLLEGKQLSSARTVTLRIRCAVWWRSPGGRQSHVIVASRFAWVVVVVFGAQRHTRDETRRPACVVVETALRTPLGPGDKT